MNKFLRGLCYGGLILMGCLNVAFAGEKTDTTHYYYQDKAISLNKAINIAKDYDVVFFDEYHDQTAIHQQELAFFKAMYKHNQDMILSMEMFERDVQPVMDNYLAGKIDEEEFKNNSRPWPNYQEDYRPLVEFAKIHDIYVLAGNIPRRMAAQYAKTGDFSLISDTDKQYLPVKHLVEHGAYYEKFTNLMSSNDEAQHMILSKDKVELFYKAQCLKDDTMAESINNYVLAHKNTKVLHVQGAFHGDEHLGVVEKLHKLNPNLKLLVITPVEAKDYNNIKDKIGKDTMILTFDRVNTEK